MTNNDILKSLRYLLNVRDAALVGFSIPVLEISTYLKNEEGPDYRECPHEVLANFLNAMVIFKRGKDDSLPTQPILVPVTNNSVLKKIRVAFELKDTDIITLIEKSGLLKVSKAELGAFFRNPDHRNYRECGDQFQG